MSLSAKARAATGGSVPLVGYGLGRGYAEGSLAVQMHPARTLRAGAPRGQRITGSTHMDRDGVDGARLEWLTVPGGKALLEPEASGVTRGVVLVQCVALI
jgi:hypothetical protein